MIIDIYDGAEYVERKEVLNKAEAHQYCDELSRKTERYHEWIEYKEMQN